MEKEKLLKAVAEFKFKDEAQVDKVLKDAQISDKAAEAVKAALKLLGAVKDELPADVSAEILSDLGELVGYPAAPEAAAPAPDAVAMAAKEAADKAAADVAAAALAPVKKADGTWDFDKIPEAVRPMVQALWKEKDASDAKLVEAVKKAETAEAVLKAQKEEQTKKEFVAKAAEFKNLGVKADEFGLVLKEVSEKAPEAYSKVEALLKAADATLATSALFIEIGSGAGGGVGGGTAQEQLEALAVGLVQKADGKKMSKEQAMSEVLKSEEGKVLYAKYLEQISKREK